MGKHPTQDYQANENFLNKKGPIQTKKNRLYFALTFYDTNNQIYLIDKVYLADSSDYIQIQNFQSIFESNYLYYKKIIEQSKLPYFVMAEKKEFKQYKWILSRQKLKFDLKSRLNYVIPLQICEKKWLVCQIILALNFLHKKNLPHSNLSLSNILVTETNQIYLTDFGFAKPHYYLNQNLNDITIFNSEIYQYCYYAPEVFQNNTKTYCIDLKNANQKFINQLLKADIFSLGCIIYEIFTGNKLFDQTSLLQFKEQNQKEQLQKKLELIQDQDIIDLLKNMLCLDPDQRLNINQVFLYWHSIVYEEQNFFVYYIDYILRHKYMSLADHQVFLVHCFFQYCGYYNQYGQNEQLYVYKNQMTCFWFQRVPFIINKIQDENFFKYFFQIIPQQQHSITIILQKKFVQFIIDYLRQLNKISTSKKTLQDVVTKQKTLYIGKRSLDSNDFNLNYIQKVEHILNSIKNEQKSTNNIIIFNFTQFLSNRIRECTSAEVKTLALLQIQKNSKFIQQIDILVKLLPIQIHLLNRSQQISKLLVFKTMIILFQQIKYIQDKRLCKPHSIENFLFVLIDNILNIQNNFILKTKFIQNLDVFLNSSFVFLISYCFQKDQNNDTQKLIKSKIFIKNYLKIQIYFINCIQKLIDTPTGYSIFLKNIPKILPFFQKSFQINNIYSILIKGLNCQNLQNQSLNVLSLIVIKNKHKLIDVLKIILQLFNFENIGSAFAVNSFIDNILIYLQDIDIIIIKTFLQIQKNILKVQHDKNVLEQSSKIIKKIFDRFNIAEINCYFKEFLNSQNDSDNDTFFQKNNIKQFCYTISNKLEHEFLKEKKRTIHESNINKQSLMLPKIINKQQYFDIQNLFDQFMFSLLYFEIPIKKSEHELTSFNKIILHINDQAAKIFESCEINWNFNQTKQSLSFEHMLIILKLLKTNVQQQVKNQILDVLNVEKFFCFCKFFEEYIRIFDLKHLQKVKENQFYFNTTDIRQLKFYGNLKSSINLQKKQIQCIAQLNKSTFLVGVDGQQLQTYNISKYKTGPYSQHLQRLNMYQTNQKFLTIEGIPSLEKALYSMNDQTVYYYDSNKNRITDKWSYQNNVNKIYFLDNTFSSLKNSFYTISDDNILTLQDTRQKKFVSQSKINPILGFTNCITQSHDYDQIYCATQKGVLLKYDLRKMSFMEFYQLKKKDKILPINHLQNFYLTSKFQNTKNKNGLLLTFPSAQNEYSIFDLEQNKKDQIFPILHFHSQEDNKQYCLSTPYFEKINIQNNYSILEVPQYSPIEIVQKLLLKRKVFQSDISQYTKIIKNQISTNLDTKSLQLLQNNTNKFITKKQNYNFSITDVITFPEIHAFQYDNQISVDNIIITSSGDLNVRFFNFGNNVKNMNPFLKDFGTFDCTHIINNDSVQRSFDYFYQNNICFLTEKIGLEQKDFKVKNFEQVFGIISTEHQFQQNGLSYDLNKKHLINLQQHQYMIYKLKKFYFYKMIKYFIL